MLFRDHRLEAAFGASGVVAALCSVIRAFFQAPPESNISLIAAALYAISAAIFLRRWL